MSAIGFIEWLSTIELYPQYRAWNILAVGFFAAMVAIVFQRLQRQYNLETAFIMSYVIAFMWHSWIDETLIIANLDIVLFQWNWPWPNVVLRWAWRVFYCYFTVRLCRHFGVELRFDWRTQISLVLLFAYFFLVPWSLYRPWDYRSYQNTSYPLWLVYVLGKGVWVFKIISLNFWVGNKNTNQRRILQLSNGETWLYTVGKGLFIYLFAIDIGNGFRNIYENLNILALVVYIHFLRTNPEGVTERFVNRGRRTIIARLAGTGEGLNIGSGGTRFRNKLNLDLHASDVDIVGDARFLPFRNGSIPNVVASEVLEHISQRELAVSEIRRVIPENGKLVLSVPQSSIMGRLSTFLYNRHEHHDHFNRKELMKNLEGFAIKQCFAYGTLPHFLKIPVGGTLITVAERKP